MNPLEQWMALDWGWGPLAALVLFLDAAGLMVWRLDRMARRGVEGTVLGTLVMPYCSGVGNLLLAGILAAQRGPGGEVVINSLVNNATNLTLLLGLPALLWGLPVVGAAGADGKKPKRKEKQWQEINRLSLLATALAGLFFTGALWALGRDGRIDFGDGLVLVGLFFFWQGVQVFEVLKGNVRASKRGDPILALDLGLLLAGGYILYCSLDWMVGWLESREGGWLSGDHLGWVTGILLVLPNAGMAMYYGWRRRPDIVASSQIGDGHICIPLCVGLFALFHPIRVPELFVPGLAVIGGAFLLQVGLLGIFGGIPRWAGAVLVAGYGGFLWLGVG